MTTTPIALVTGATNGLGRAVALVLAQQGMHVLVHGRDARRAEAVVARIGAAGGSAQTVNCLHPASLMNTHMVRESLVPPLSTVASGVEAVTNLAIGPAGGSVTGRYFDGLAEVRAHAATYDAAIRKRLRDITTEILGSRSGPG